MSAAYRAFLLGTAADIVPAIGLRVDWGSFGA